MPIPPSTWTIYFSPEDVPGLWCVRRFELVNGSPEPRTLYTLGPTGTLEDARALIPPGLLCWPRDPSDPPSVVETWL